MYLPRSFAGSPETARELLRAHPFATVVGASPDEDSGSAFAIAHVPLFVDLAGDALRITGHVARANPFARLVATEANVTAVFHGPEAYVSASVYESPHEQVPTWNYAVVHVRGRLRLLDDAALVEQLTAMAERFEREPERWHPSLLSPEFFADLRRGIVGFGLEVADVQTKLKLSQNRSPVDRERVEAGFAKSEAPREREVAALMRRLAEAAER